MIAGTVAGPTYLRGSGVGVCADSGVIGLQCALRLTECLQANAKPIEDLRILRRQPAGSPEQLRRLFQLAFREPNSGRHVEDSRLFYPGGQGVERKRPGAFRVVGAQRVIDPLQPLAAGDPR